MGPPIIVYALAVLLLNSCASQPSQPAMDMNMNHSPLDQKLRVLWGENSVLLRRNALDRIPAKQDEIANVIAPYYGNATADKVAAALKRFMTTRTHTDAVEVASLLKESAIAGMLDQLAAATTTEQAFDQAMKIADAIADRATHP